MFRNFGHIDSSFDELIASVLERVCAYVDQGGLSFFGRVENVREQSISAVVALPQLAVDLLARPCARHNIVQSLHLYADAGVQQVKEMLLLPKEYSCARYFCRET